MKTNKLTAKLLLSGLTMGFGLALALSACKSSEETVAVFEQPDYTLEDVRREEIKRINQIAEEDIVKAYWRSTLLNDKATVDAIGAKLIEQYNKALEEEKFFTAKRLVKALEDLNDVRAGSLSKSSARLEELCNKTVNGFESTKSRDFKVSQLIDGTVTVWVDKGIKVENGMGFADRVIGSGFFISKDGYIVTNHHVIADLVNPKYEGYARLYVKLAQDSETRIPAKVVGWDSVVDLAVLKAEVDAPYVFALGSSNNLDVGDKIFCIGSPIGLERTLTSGIVSARDRVLFSAGPVMQIDAAVNSGNSGGPCVDEKGAVQAVVFAGMLQYSGLNFAIPVEYLKAELPVLINGGKFEHSWMESNGRTHKVGLKDNGVELNYVMPGGCAWRAGLRAKDVITKIEDIAVLNLEDVQKVMMGITSKSTVKVTYYSEADGPVKTTVVYVTDRPLNPGYQFYKNDIVASSFTPIFGMKLNAVTQGRKRYQIAEVIRGSIADESGFSENDPIEIKNISFNNDNTALYAEIYAKNRKKGYLDINMGIAAPLDSPYYF